MAKNLAMIVNDKTHGTCINTKAMLEGLGHTVTVFGETEITASNLETFDLIMTVRASNAGAPWQDIVVGYRNAGKPVILGLDQGTDTGLDTESFIVGLRLATTLYTQSSFYSATITDNTHPITNGFASQSYDVYSSASYISTVMTESDYGPYVGVPLAHVTTTYSSRKAIVAYEKDSLDLDGNPIPSRMAFIGFLYGLNGYTADGATLINNAVLWATEPVAVEEPEPQPEPEPNLIPLERLLAMYYIVYKFAVVNNVSTVTKQDYIDFVSDIYNNLNDTYKTDEYWTIIWEPNPNIEGSGRWCVSNALQTEVSAVAYHLIDTKRGQVYGFGEVAFGTAPFGMGITEPDYAGMFSMR